jgi:diguanylate cyclase (GGDEF)-like protein/PAS domain S-box-containing protein
LIAAVLDAVRRAVASLSDTSGAAVRLFAPGGPFASFPGPAACVGAKGELLAANPRAGAMMADAARAESHLGVALRQALAEGVTTTASYGMPGNQSTVTVTVVPMSASHGGRTASPEAALLLGYDMTLVRNLRAALTESRQRYKDLVEISSDFAWETDAEGKLVFVSPRGALGFHPGDMVGRDPGALFAVEPQEEASSLFATRVPREDVTVWARSASGAAACLLASCVPVSGEDGAWRGARGVARDVTDARERDAALARARAREQLLAYIVRQIRDEIAPQNMMNAAAATIVRGFGVSGCRIYRAAVGGFAVAAESGAVPESPEAPLSGFAPGADRLRAADGKHFVVAVATRYRQAVNGAIALWRDAGARDFDSDDLTLLSEVASQIGIALEQLANHEELERMSCTDALTGLLNRRIFIDAMSRRLVEAARTGRAGALCYLDLDNFKDVNDTHGHRRGDKALLAVADLLRAQVRENDLVARLGGDEFALWLEKMDVADALAKAKALLQAASGLEGFSADGAHPLGFSIGVAVFDPAGGERLDQLMARADEAMYAVKRAGKSGFELADPAPGVPRAAGASR